MNVELSKRHRISVGLKFPTMNCEALISQLLLDTLNVAILFITSNVGYYRITVRSSTRNSHLLVCIDLTIVIFDYYSANTRAYELGGSFLKGRDPFSQK